MKKLTIITCFFALIALNLQGSTITQNDEINEITASTPVVIELGYTTIRAGLATAATPNMVFNASINWEGTISKSNLESLLTQVFDQLNVTPSNHPVMITYAPESNASNREVLAEVLMGTFKVPAIYMAKSHVLALYATGKTTGTVVYLQSDNGSNIMTNSVSINDGYIHAVSLKKMNHQTLDIKAFGEQVNASYESSSITIRSELKANTLLIGNDSRVPQIADALKSAIKDVATYAYLVNITTPSDYMLMVWKGAKALASQSYFLDLCFTQAEYAKDGASGVHKKVQ